MQKNNLSTLIKRSNVGDRVLVTNSVIRNTYLLLSLTLLFSAGTAFLSSITNAPFLGFGFTLLLNLGLIYLVNTLRNSAWGILAVFIFTGFFGYTLGPIINTVLYNFTNGQEILTTSLGLTGIMFLGLSAYAMASRKDFSYMRGFLFVGVLLAIIGGCIAVLFNIPLLSLVVSSAFILLASGLILYETSQIIHGGETNYIIATITLYVQIYNLFVSLLQILMIFSGRRN